MSSKENLANTFGTLICIEKKLIMESIQESFNNGLKSGCNRRRSAIVVP
jgi:hypothetical protein